MKRIIFKVLSQFGYNIVRSSELSALQMAKQKKLELLSEHYYLSSTNSLIALPNILPTPIHESLTRLIGTTPYEGLWILDALYRTKELPGDICEFGIAQGATSRLLGSFIMEERSSKKLVLIDSFQGLSEPTKEDELKDDIFKLGSIQKYSGSMAYDANFALQKLKEIKFPDNQLQIIPGFIQDSIKTEAFPEAVSFAYVDFDLYEPIKIALNYLDQVTAIGSVIIVDDYDFFSTGAKKAVDEFMNLNDTRYTFEAPPTSLGHFCILTRI